MGMFDFMDRDNDGSAIDDAFVGAANLGGAALVGLGGLAAGVGGVMLGGGLVTTATGIGAPLGLSAAGVGGALVGLGSLGAAAGGMMMTATGNAVAEEAGDFTADLFGTRGASPYPSQPNGDPHYASGRTDGLGQQLNHYLHEHPIEPTLGNPTPSVPGLTD